MFLRSRQPTRIPLAQVAMGAAQLAFFQLSGAVLLGGTTKTFRGPRPAPVAEAVTLSPLVFGTLRLHETEDPFALLTEAWNLGITSFDCAAVYGGGRCEEILGAWLRDGATPAGTTTCTWRPSGACAIMVVPGDAPAGHGERLTV